MTLADACRALEIDRATLKKWRDLGYITVITIGPPGHEIPRVHVSEVERLKPR
jgi:predicted site-specific integrase-resolvase